MIELHVMRRFYAESFTLGDAFVGTAKWHCLELPWAYNHVDESCIPTGAYKATRHTRADGMHTLLLDGIEGRSAVEVHAGNTTGQTHGCILLGKTAFCSLLTAGLSESDKAMEEMLTALGEDQEVVVNVVNYGDLAHDHDPYPQGESKDDPAISA